MIGTKDNIDSLLEYIELQGLSYFLMILSPNKEKNDDIEIFTSINQAEIGKVMKVLSDYKKKSESEEKDKKEKDKDGK